jgi:hypothetical protein
MAIVCVFITAVPLIKLFSWGEGESGGHVLRETTSRGRCGLGCPSRTSERSRNGIVDCLSCKSRSSHGLQNVSRTIERILRVISFTNRQHGLCL